MGQVSFKTGVSVGDEPGVFVIAEAGVNHDGRLPRARKLVEAAAEAGADAVKFQTFQTDALSTAEAEKAEYQKDATDDDQTQAELLRELELSEGEHRALCEECRRRGIQFLSTPFDAGSADFLDELGVPLFKIGSGDLTNLPFLEHVAGTGRPMIVSTGMSTLGDVERAVETIEATGQLDFALLHCVSCYPTDPADANLRAMDTLERAFPAHPVGFSDHTMGLSVPLAAAARGAEVIEKHLTLDRSLEGPDHAASLEPDELAELVEGIRTVESALGDGRKRPVAAELETADVARKSIVTDQHVPKGTEITAEMLAMKRPGTGLEASLLPEVVGRTAARDLPADTLVTFQMLTGVDTD